LTLANPLIPHETPEVIAKMKKMPKAGRSLEPRYLDLNYRRPDLLPITSMVTKDIGDIEMDERTNRIIVWTILTDPPMKLGSSF